MTPPASSLADPTIPPVSEEAVPTSSSSPSCISRSLGRGWSMISYAGSKIGSGATYLLTPVTSAAKVVTGTVTSIFSSSSTSSAPTAPPLPNLELALKTKEPGPEVEIEIDVEGDSEAFQSLDDQRSGILSTIRAYTLTPLISMAQSISRAVKGLFSSSTSAKPEIEEEIVDDFIESEELRKPVPPPSSLPIEFPPPSSNGDDVENLGSSDAEGARAEIEPEPPLSPEMEADLNAIEIAPTEAVPVPPKIIRVPAKGYCLFAAVLVGLVRQNQDNEELMRKLGVNPADFQGDDFTSDEAIGMIEGHANHLREKVINHMLKELEALQNTPNLLKYLVDTGNDMTKQNRVFLQEELRDNFPEECASDSAAQLTQIYLLPPSKNRNKLIRINKISQMIAHLKHAIYEYNENIERNIQDRQEAFETNTNRFLTLQEEANSLINTLKNFSFNDSKKINNHTKSLRILEERLAEIRKKISLINDPITRNLTEVMQYSQNKLACTPTGFSRSEIPALKSYLNLMREPTQYASISEIIALSHLYEVPIQVYYNPNHDYSNFHDPDFKTKELRPQTFNDNLNGKPIRLDYDGQHYNLLLV